MTNRSDDLEEAQSEQHQNVAEFMMTDRKNKLSSLRSALKLKPTMSAADHTYEDQPLFDSEKCSLCMAALSGSPETV